MNGWEELNEALGAIPLLEDAACSGRPGWFDLDPNSGAEVIERAKLVCAGCLALADCSRWVEGLPPRKRPTGVVAGHLIIPPAPRPRPVKPPKPAKPSTPRQPRPRLDAAQWLADRLAAGPVLKSVLVADGAKAGLSASTLERAARRLGVVSERLPGRRGPVLWSLPDAGVIDAVPMSEGTAG